jgi:dipeptidyl aminopeptidase/acylaminoacyl peptidase
MGLDIAQLFSTPTYRSMDLDEVGRALITSDETGSQQLVEIDTDGILTQLTALPDGCTGRYLPGSRTVVVLYDEGGNERTQIGLLRLDTGVTLPAGLPDIERVVSDSRYVHELEAVSAERICYKTNRRNGVDFDVVVRDVASGEETVAYDGGGMVQQAAMSRDGRWIAFTLPGVPALSDQLLVVDLDEPAGPDRARPVTAAGEHARVITLEWTPSADALVVTTDRDRDMCGIARHEPATGGWSWLVTDDRHDLFARLSPDGATVLVESNVEGSSRITLYDAATGARLRGVDLPGLGCVQGYPLPDPVWAPVGDAVLMSWSTPTVPGDVLRLDVSTGEVRALTDCVRHLGEGGLSEPTDHRIATPDGEQVPCLVYPPVAGGDPALRGSSVLFVHGGPEGQAKRMYTPVIGALTLAGYTVLVPNVRGSIGYGKRWYSLDDVRLRLDSVADLGALHAHLPALGLDQRRSALWGGSYGGYMVLAGLAFQPDLWAAGVDIVGISSLVTFLENTSPYRRAHREREYGSLAEDREFLHAASPMTRIGAIRAPLFVIHGRNDPRVPVTEAHQVHAALTGNAVPCELMIFDDEGHGLTKRANRLEAYPRAIEFLRAHLAGRH